MTSLLNTLAAVAFRGEDPDQALVRRLRSGYPDAANLALPPTSGHPYSRRTLYADDSVEIMVARWEPTAACAPHDHGGCAGFVVALEGALTETDFFWRDGDLVAAEPVSRAAGSARGFGPEVIHAMRAEASGAVTLHVYAPQPLRMNVYDLERREVLDLVGDFGAWIPEGEHPRMPFGVAAAPR